MSQAPAHVQRTRHKVPGFDPHNDAHVTAVETKISEAAGSGFKVVGFDAGSETVTIDGGRSVTIELPCRPYDPTTDTPDPPR